MAKLLEQNFRVENGLDLLKEQKPNMYGKYPPPKQMVEQPQILSTPLSAAVSPLKEENLARISYSPAMVQYEDDVRSVCSH